ncbi:diacylglycerol O-acyltransferase 2 [Callorhinchus milii]|uniref:diacylglycerol O-acyltransferase 2 n=1 Tax=Callorhinchus milii TaxID=7868 RepID=UPI001C3FA878|nr:diacylglycerol O-acyltransferase 2 [Callorhinchus milii]XP_042201486.1 diacylglycerol O-acyltransferase 2 [Callorhinchus milii]XP_042201487.1 diacylglycerol O-acyltransferase 2 [Callorhinchus milii]
MSSSLLKRLNMLQIVLTFLVLGPLCTLLTLYLLLTPLWPLTALYGVWMVFDWRTPERGGRKSDWVRRWRTWEFLRDYFPITLVKTAELPRDRNYVLGYHPHGILATGAFCNFGTEATGFSRLFPGITPRLVVLQGLFRLPLFREYVMSVGVCSVNKRSVTHLLARSGVGNAVVIVVGGAAEALTRTGVHAIILKHRKGFVRLALEHGADLVPVYCFGENSLYEQVVLADGGWAQWLQKGFQQLIGFAPCLIRGQGLFTRGWGLLPNPQPLTTFVGAPIPVTQTHCPSQADVDHYHSLYVAAVTELFNQHKEACGLPTSAQLLIM